MCQFGPHLDTLPDRYLYIPYPETGLPTHITVDKLINDYDETLKQNLYHQAHFEIKYNRDEKDDILVSVSLPKQMIQIQSQIT